jgi:probable HAF family extracellular repeat protein
MNIRHWMLIMAAAVGGCDAARTPTEPYAPVPQFSEHGALDVPTGAYRVQEVVGDAAGSAINGAAEVAGQLRGGGPSNAFFWSPSTGGTVIDVTTGNTIWSFSINEHSVVLGTRRTGLSETNVPLWGAYRWTAGGGVQDLVPPDPSHDVVIAGGLNDAGMAVGHSRPVGAVLTEVAVVWAPDGSAQSIGTLGGSFSQAFGLNNLGQVVGESQLAAGGVDAFVWTEAGGMQALGLDGLGSARAVDINEQGEIVGLIFGSPNRRAFYWSEAAGYLDLHAAAGITQPESWAPAINESGEIAITAVSGAVFSAYVWSPVHGLRTLPPLGPGSSSAHGINDAGLLVGTSANSAVIWRPETVGDLVDDLGDLVRNLPDATPGVNGLRAMLRSIEAHIAAGRTTPARNQIAALKNLVAEMVADGRIMPEEGEQLLAAADALLASL